MSITPGLTLKHTEPTKGFLCPVSANHYGISFKSFRISNHETKSILFDTAKATEGSMEIEVDSSEPEENRYRRIRYTFPEEVLKIPRMETSLTFRVGDRPLHSFRMIERHYFRDELIKSYDFIFGFVIPNSTNTWDSVYQIPALPPSLIDAMIKHPYECKSDSFYFVGDELVMHHKVSYKYAAKDSIEGDLLHADAKTLFEVQQAESKNCEEEVVDNLVNRIADAKIVEDNECKAWAKDTK